MTDYDDVDPRTHDRTRAFAASDQHILDVRLERMRNRLRWDRDRFDTALATTVWERQRAGTP